MVLDPHGVVAFTINNCELLSSLYHLMCQALRGFLLLVTWYLVLYQIYWYARSKQIQTSFSSKCPQHAAGSTYITAAFGGCIIAPCRYVARSTDAAVAAQAYRYHRAQTSFGRIDNDL